MMQLAESHDFSAHPQQGGFHTLTLADRKRASGPGLRAFRAIAAQWGLSERERIVILGEPGRSTYHQWMKKAQADEPVTLPLDTLLRISAVLGIYKALAILFEDPNQAQVWLKGAHKGTLFSGASPLAYILDGTHDGIMSVRRYLDAWRGGHIGHGAPEGSFEPVGDADIVFV
ncbi:MAG: hypothetical protein ACJA06_001624 [Halocynthiibacter sp.]|jgi:hypothetical protein